MQYLQRFSTRYSYLISPGTIGFFATMAALILSITRGIENLGLADGSGYIEQANGMLKGIDFVFNNPSIFFHNLGFSFFIALTFIFSQSTSLLLLKIFLAVSHGIAAYLLAQIGREVGLRRRFWTAGGVLFSLDPFMLRAATNVGTETLTTLIVVYWCHLYITSVSAKSYQFWRILFFMFSGFFAITMRPNFLFPFFFVSILLLIKWHKEAIQFLIIKFSVILFIIFLTLYEVFLIKLNDGFVFLATYGGFGVGYACRAEFIPQYLGFASAEQNEKINYWLNVENPLKAEILAKSPSISPLQIDHEMMRLGISNCLENPLQSVGVLILKFLAIWRPFTGLGSHGIAVLIFSALVLVPTTYGTLTFLFKKKLDQQARLIKRFFVVISIGFVPSLLITTEQLRHRLAFAEPFYWIFSIACIQYWIDARKSSVKNK